MMGLSIIYFALLVAVLVSRLIPGLESLECFTKPALMPMLILMLLKAVKVKSSLVWLLVVSLLFSCAGDTFLMFSGPSYFIAGLASFLLAHLCYIWLFTKTADGSPGYLVQNPIKVLPFILYGIGLVVLLWSSLADMKLPVTLYALSILGMVLTAFNRRGRASRLSYQWVFCGALLFLISDSMIAINRFHSSIPYAQIWIMITYGVSQFLIVKGILDWFQDQQSQVGA